MKNKFITITLFFSLVNSNTITPISEFTKKALILIPVNLAAILLGRGITSYGNSKYDLANNILKGNPQDYYNAISNFCADYTKSIPVSSSKNRIRYVSTPDNSLSLALINASGNIETFKNFAAYVSRLMKNEANNYLFAGCALPIVSIVGSAVYLYAKYNEENQKQAKELANNKKYLELKNLGMELQIDNLGMALQKSKLIDNISKDLLTKLDISPNEENVFDLTFRLQLISKYTVVDNQRWLLMGTAALFLQRLSHDKFKDEIYELLDSAVSKVKKIIESK